METEIILSARLLLILAGLPLGAGLVVGLSAGILQAVTQIQEQTLSSIPRIMTIGLVVVFFLEPALDQLGPLLNSIFLEIQQIGLGEN